MLQEIGAGLQIASALFQFNGQKRQASNQSNAIEAGQQAQHAALDEQSAQIDASAVDQISARAREAMIERGRLAAVLADSGLAGQGAAHLYNASRFAEGFDISAIDENRKRQQRQVDRQQVAVDANTEAKFASIPQPSLIGTGLQIGGSLISYASKQPNGGR